ncbi:hypothetical protein CQ14_29310 [Bradyrhizobium lablabi]|uniref:Uncharacterized protein n=1 Tax=Bradyrhizobium lablabi TaxID=722472 RepID=A0A0R3N5J0_9BRAD|nr:hypothetical protein CQ14_29310 [Bradyrhizobium lablabi]
MLGDSQPPDVDLQTFGDRRNARLSGSVDNRYHLEIPDCIGQFIVEQARVERTADRVRRRGQKTKQPVFSSRHDQRHPR